MYSILRDGERLQRMMLGLLGVMVAGHYLLAVYLPRWQAGTVQPPLTVSLVAELEAGFITLGYTADHLPLAAAPVSPGFYGAGLASTEGREVLWVPRAYLASLPGDWRHMRDASRRKNLFIRAILPLVLLENERILAVRARVLKGDPADDEWRRALAARYRLPSADLARLARRIDIIPPSLAIAQAAIESGWGSSRFSRQGNALFGEWTWTGKGIVPAGREAGRTHMIKAFDSLGGSVASYMKNLNSHRAYAGLRRWRETRRRQGKAPSGLSLTATLIDYSQKGQAYVSILDGIIRRNSLAALDGARLLPAGEPLPQKLAPAASTQEK